MTTDHTHTTELPSGRKATVARGRGRDLLAAQRAARDHHEIPYALVARLAHIDGKPLVLEEVLELDLADVMALQAQLLEGQGDFFQALSTSSSSPSSPAGGSESSKSSPSKS